MYRLMGLAIQGFSCTTDSSSFGMHQNLTAVPFDVGDTYDGTWNRVSATKMERARDAFCWILSSLPLRIDYSRVAIALSRALSGLNSLKLQRNASFDMASDLDEISGHLVPISLTVDVSHL
jgi:hypothetical protein